MADKSMTALLILDGFGMADAAQEGNCIVPENIPGITRLMAEYPHGQIGASGMDVGLPDGQMGNSEVGHTNIGAGRVVYQELTRITKAIKDGDFFENEALCHAFEYAKANNSKVHLIGLVSDGGVHSHLDHLCGLLEMGKRMGQDKLYVHCLMDGRDTPPASGKGYIEQLMDAMERIGAGKIATVTGRYYGMDRDNRWDRVQRAWEAMALGRGETAACPLCAMQQSYDKGENDEFVQPTVIMENGAPVAKVEEGDAIIFFNFRPDRAREITRTFIEEEFAGFEREGGHRKVFYVCMTQYDATFKGVEIAFKPQKLTNTFGEYLAACGKTQLRIAETEKYAHVTFFFNGGVEQPNEGEDRCLVASPKVATYDLQPEMSALEVTEKAIEHINSGKFDAMILNFANCDMVGHTGVIEAATKAVQTVDACVTRVVEAILANGGRCLITADHGNAEQMIDTEVGGAFTAHTTNPVPLILVDNERKDAQIREGGRLCDLAPTLLQLMGLEKPAEMTGESLIK